MKAESLCMVFCTNIQFDCSGKECSDVRSLRFILFEKSTDVNSECNDEECRDARLDSLVRKGEQL